MRNPFKDPKKELFVITTITNWKEPPRIRHEIARQLARKYNVLFIQIYAQRGKTRERADVSDSLKVEKAGVFFVGGVRLFLIFPMMRKIYNHILAVSIKTLVKKYGYSKANLMNFQYDFPEVYSGRFFEKKIYFCNDDFVNQQLNNSRKQMLVRERVQIEVIKKSDTLIVVSYPLEDKLKKYGTRTKVLLSGHRFDLEKSRLTRIDASTDIRVCYLGFLNQYIELDWLNYILDHENIVLTVIGPFAYKYLQDELGARSNFRHIESLVDCALQQEMLRHDVMIMPYSSPVANDVTSVPAKLFQYLAVGKPVVASAMRNLIELPAQFVYKATGKEEFLSLIEKCHAENSEPLRESRIEFAAKHTWDQRGDQLFNILDESS